jgi:hypothetical protein
VTLLQVLCAGTRIRIDPGIVPALDSGIADSGMADSGMADSGMADSGMADSGMADSGTVPYREPRYRNVFQRSRKAIHTHLCDLL